MKGILAMAMAFGLLGCGSIIGDPCTTNAECGGQICVNQDYTPGGYCSRQCTLADDRTCPVGSICLKDGQSQGNPACFRICRSQLECRTGYVCRTLKESTSTVCVGPNGN